MFRHVRITDWNVSHMQFERQRVAFNNEGGRIVREFDRAQLEQGST